MIILKTYFLNSSIKRKLMTIILLICGVALFLSSLAFIVNEAITFRRGSRDELSALADIIGNNTAAAIMFNDQNAAAETLAGLRANPRIIAAYIFTRNGALFTDYVATGINKTRLKLCTSTQAEPSGEHLLTLSALVQGADPFWDWGMDLYAAKRIVMDGKIIGTVVIQSDMQGLLAKLNLFFIVVAIVLLVTSAIAYLLSSRLQSLISQPIQHLAQTMKKVSYEKNYALRSKKTSTDEIGMLIDGFNEMLAEIEERDEVLKQRQNHLQRLAHFDNLTRLPNRALFYDRLTQALHQAERLTQQVAIMFIDLDHFKDINDTFGHRVGDLLLKEVAKRLLTIIRSCDTVARMGGDEFTIFSQNVENAEHACIIAQKIVKDLANPYFVENKEIYATASIGIAIYPCDGTTVDELLKNADAAMYHAKDNGKNLFQFYSQEMNIRTSRRLAMQNSLRHALERNEFTLYYQPKMDIATGLVTGLEALLRWTHPEEGLIGPDKFIHLAEDTGLILPIGEWVLRTVCQQIKTWQEEGLPPLRVAVNVSGCQFRRQNLAETVRRIIAETGIPSSLLELELTESTIMQDVENSVGLLQTLKGMGIHISIDDFGTGYSSLSHLKRFPIDTLKIDRSFIFNVTTNSDDFAIVTAIIAMARSLNLNIIAEGVETEDQLSFLSEQGCHEIQGYLYSRPVPSAKLIHLLQERNSPLRDKTAPHFPL